MAKPPIAYPRVLVVVLQTCTSRMPGAPTARPPYGPAPSPPSPSSLEDFSSLSSLEDFISLLVAAAVQHYRQLPLLLLG